MASHSSEIDFSEDSLYSPAGNEIMETETRPSCRKRAASESKTAVESKLVRLEIEDACKTTPPVTAPKSVAVIKPFGFLSTEKMTTRRISKDTDPCEEMMLYNRRRSTLSLLSSKAVLTTQSIKQPLARMLCLATFVVIRDDRVFLSIYLGNSHVIQVYDLHEGNLVVQVENSSLVDTAEILLNSTGKRIYAANFGGSVIFEVRQNGRVKKIAEVEKPIWNFWVEHQDESIFICSYVQVSKRQPFSHICYKTRVLEHKIQRKDIADYMIIGRSAGRCYLLHDGQNEIAVIYQDGAISQFCLDGAIDSVFSLNHCGNLIYILKRDRISVINTETKHRRTIKNIRGSEKVDEECQLIRCIRTTTDVNVPHPIKEKRKTL